LDPILFAGMTRFGVSIDPGNAKAPWAKSGEMVGERF
jgi:hypothetical protein